MPEKQLFLEKQVECPVCKQKSNYQYPDPDLYEYFQDDQSLYKISFRWNEPYFNHYNPFFYHFWSCSRCSFTNTYDVIHKDKQFTEKNLQLAESFSNLKYNENKALKLLTYGLKKNTDDYLRSIIQHYLYIFIIESTEEAHTEFINIAFNYLRLSTLFEEHEEINKDTNYKKVQDYYNFFSGSFLSFFDENSVRFRDFSTHNYKFSSRSKSIFEEIRSKYYDMQNLLEEIKERHLEGRESINRLLKEKKHKSIFTKRFLDFISFDDYLNKVKSRWFKIPLNTEHLIATACSYLVKVITSEQLKKNISYHINVIEILAACYTKIDEVVKVIKTYELGIKQLNKYIASLSETAMEIKSHPMNHDRLNSIKDKIIEIKTKHDEFIEKRGKLIKDFKEKQTKLAVELISKYKYDNEEDLYRYLERNKIHKEVIEQYVRLKPKQKNRFSFTFFKPN